LTHYCVDFSPPTSPQPKNLMVSAGARTKEYDKSRYISILNIIQARAWQCAV
jgi:hypothetical protein